MSRAGHKFRQLVNHIRKSPVGTSLIPMDSAVGFTYLIDRRNINKWTVAIPFCAEQVKAEGECYIFPPRLVVELDIDIKELLNESSDNFPLYRILTVGSPIVDGTFPIDIAKAPMAKFPHNEIATLTRSQYLDKIDELNSVVASMLFNLKSNTYDPALDQMYVDQVNILMPKSSMPVYSKLSAWLQYYISQCNPTGG